jgi:hypothetical protein
MGPRGEATPAVTVHAVAQERPMAMLEQAEEGPNPQRVPVQNGDGLEEVLRK